MNLKSAFLRFILEVGVNLGVRGDSFWGYAIPCALVVKETICSLFEFFRNRFRFLVSLEPRLVLLVKPPTLVLQGLGREVLLICSLLVVEDVKEGVRIDPLVEPRIFENCQRLLRKLVVRVIPDIGVVGSRELSVEGARLAR